MRALLAATLAAVPVGCSSAVTDDGAERPTLADGSEALRWGDGAYGVVLAAADAGQDAADRGRLAEEIAPTA